VAISYIAAARNTWSSGEPTITHGLTIIENDVLVAVIHINDYHSYGVASSGFTEDVDQSTIGTSSFMLCHKVAGASEPGTYTWDVDTTSDYGGVTLLQFRGVDTDNVWDVAPPTALEYQPSAGDWEGDDPWASPQALSRSTSYDGSMAILVAMVDTGAYYDYFTAVGNSFENLYNTPTGSASSVVIGTATKTISTAGAIGTTSITPEVSSQDCTVGLMALRAASAGTDHPLAGTVSATAALTTTPLLLNYYTLVATQDGTEIDLTWS